MRRILVTHRDERPGASTSSGISRIVILAVDDEPDVLQLLEWFLSDAGLEVITASSGTEALERVAERPPDLIITDYRMPDMSGLTLCRRLRQRCSTRRIPIILHTGVATTLPPNSPLYDRVIAKPSDVPALVREVRALLAAPH
jgi:CheY-like chemotaxis protein